MGTFWGTIIDPTAVTSDLRLRGDSEWYKQKLTGEAANILLSCLGPFIKFVFTINTKKNLGGCFSSKKIMCPNLSHVLSEQWLELSESKNKDLFVFYILIDPSGKWNK